METNGPTPDPYCAIDWELRKRVWAKKLGRIRLGVEPVEQQLAKYRRVTWMLSAVASGIGAMFVALFTAFGRGDVGLVLSGIVLLPVVLIAWVDLGVLEYRVSRFLVERDAFEKKSGASGGS